MYVNQFFRAHLAFKCSVSPLIKSEFAILDLKMTPSNVC